MGGLVKFTQSNNWLMCTLHQIILAPISAELSKGGLNFCTLILLQKT